MSIAAGIDTSAEIGATVNVGDRADAISAAVTGRVNPASAIAAGKSSTAANSKSGNVQAASSSDDFRSRWQQILQSLDAATDTGFPVVAQKSGPADGTSAAAQTIIVQNSVAGDSASSNAATGAAAQNATNSSAVIKTNSAAASSAPGSSKTYALTNQLATASGNSAASALSAASDANAHSVRSPRDGAQNKQKSAMDSPSASLFFGDSTLAAAYNTAQQSDSAQTRESLPNPSAESLPNPPAELLPSSSVVSAESSQEIQGGTATIGKTLSVPQGLANHDALSGDLSSGKRADESSIQSAGIKPNDGMDGAELVDELSTPSETFSGSVSRSATSQLVVNEQQSTAQNTQKASFVADSSSSLMEPAVSTQQSIDPATIDSPSLAVDGAAAKSTGIVAKQASAHTGTRASNRNFVLDTAGGSGSATAHFSLTDPNAAMLRDTENLHGSADSAASARAAATGTEASSTPSTQDPFTALDAGTHVGTPAWTHASVQHAEAGFQDPALGWVGVRADLSGGGVHASLVPGSSEAAQVLSSHMAALNNYLNEQQTPVATLTMSDAGAMASDMGHNMQQSPGQNADTSQSASSFDSESMAPSAISTGASTQAAASGELNSLPYTTGTGGTYISVVA